VIKMKTNFFNHILVSMLFFTCFYTKAGAQDIKVDAKLEQSTIRIGDQTFLHFTVQQPAKAKVNFPVLTDTLTGKIQIVKAGKLDTVADKNNPANIIVNQEYTITGFDAGTYTIPSFAFGTSVGVIKTNELILQVASVKVDTTKSIYDIKQPLAVSYTWLDWLKDNWYWIAGIVAVILISIGIIWYLKKRPKTEKPIKPIFVPTIPPQKIALDKLKQLKEKKLWQQEEFKLYHSEISDILREYLEKRYSIKTYEKTTDEIFAGLRYLDIKEESKNTLRQILTLADLVKFAKEKPLPSENELSLENAVVFILETKQEISPNKPEGGNENV